MSAADALPVPDSVLQAAYVRVLPPLAFVTVLIALVAPRGSALCLLILCAALAVPAVRSGFRDAVWPLPGLMLSLAAAGAYIAVNALWSANVSEAYGKVGYFTIAVAATYAAVCGVRRLDRVLLGQTGWAIFAAVVAGMVFLTVEVLLDQPIKRMVLSAIPLFKVEAKHMKVGSDGTVSAINPYVLNRNLGILSLAFWPAMLIAAAVLRRHVALWLTAVLVVLFALTVLKSEHETSVLALAFAALTWAGMRFRPDIMRKAVIAGWIMATMLVVPIAAASYSAKLYEAQVIPQTGRNRIVLWGFTAHEIRKNPILGVGIASTKELDDQVGPAAAKPADHPYALRTGRHSHNVFMQTWYELGATGAVLLLSIGLVILSSLRTTPRLAAPFAHAAFVSAVLTACFSWGIWQVWFLSGFCLSALLLVIALQLVDEQKPA